MGPGPPRYRRKPAAPPKMLPERFKGEIDREKMEIKAESVKRTTIEKLQGILRKRIQAKVSKEIEGTRKKKILKSLAAIGGIAIASATIQMLAPILAETVGLSLVQTVSTLETLKKVGVAAAESLADKSFVSMATSLFSGLITQAAVSGTPVAEGIVKGVAGAMSKKLVGVLASNLGINESVKPELRKIVERATEESIKEVSEEISREEMKKLQEG